MRTIKDFITLGTLILLAVTFGCGGSGGGDGSGSSTGTVSMSITDAKPVLPDNVTNCYVIIDQVMAHSPGGGWVPLKMVQTPYRIDLLEFTDGISTEFVPPAEIEAGKYTQIRLSVTEAKLRFLYPATGLEPERTEDVTVTIPSENLKTDQNFDFEVTGSEPSAVDITIDFDLSQSIVVEGPAGNPTYKLKPVLHIVKTEEAATINVIINNLTQNARITVLSKDTQGEYTEEYTEVEVQPGTTIYPIFWIVPNQDYLVKIDYDPTDDSSPVYEKEVSFGEGPGQIADVTF